MKSIRKAVVGNQCVSCGTCVKECPFQAITIDKGIKAVVNFEKCVGCGKCKRVCPASVIEIQEIGGNADESN